MSSRGPEPDTAGPSHRMIACAALRAIVSAVALVVIYYLLRSVTLPLAPPPRYWQPG